MVLVARYMLIDGQELGLGVISDFFFYNSFALFVLYLSDCRRPHVPQLLRSTRSR